MKVFYSDQFVIPLPPGHRFPMQKYAMLRHRVVATGVVPVQDLIVPHAATDEELQRAHTPEYVRRVSTGDLSPAEVRRIGLPWSPGLVERSRRSCGATIEACRGALSGEGLAINLAGGTHHAFSDRGEGYCVFNDVAVATRAMLAEGRCRRVAIIDCDVHQGNGTASILGSEDRAFTFSIHGAKNFPLHKERSSMDVELPDGSADKEYLDALEEGVRRTLALSGADLAIYLAGADPFSGDTLGRLKVSKEGLAQRDRMVLELCRQGGLPVAITMAGGYARHVEDTVDIHLQTVCIAMQVG